MGRSVSRPIDNITSAGAVDREFEYIGFENGAWEQFPRKASIICVLNDAVMKKSKKHRARTPARFSRNVFSTFLGTSATEC